MMVSNGSWQGRFPQNEIISLLNVNRRFNLAESTSQDMSFGELLDMADCEQLRELKLGYGSSAGDLALRQAVGIACNVAPDEVLTTQGTALGLFLIAFELCRPGDEVVLVSPCFPPSRDALLGNGIKIIDVPVFFDDGFTIDIGRVAAALTSRTRLVSLASPQNPSGVATSVDDINSLLDMMKIYAPQAQLFVDETYREAVYGEATTPPSVAGLDKRIITGASISKALGAPGLRTGWLTIPDPSLYARLEMAKMNMVISGSVLDEALAAVLMLKRQTVLLPRRKLLEKAMAMLEHWCEVERARIEWVRPDGGAMCCIRLRIDVFDDEAISRFRALLPEYEVQLAGGDWFGADARVFRLGFGYLPLPEFERALAALSLALSSALCRA